MDRNRAGALTALKLGLVLYPVFGVIDWLHAPPGRLWLLWGTRLAHALLTFALFPVVRSAVFNRRPYEVSGGYLAFGGLGISLMTMLLNGLESPYYAGLALIIVASGLLFVWPAPVVAVTQGVTLLSFVVPNLIFHPVEDAAVATSNLFFLLATSVLVGVGQVLSYRSLHEQVTNQVLIERTGAALQSANEQLTLLDQHRAKFLANITHEFKTPLTIVMTPLQAQLQGDRNQPVALERARVQSMYRACMQVLKMVDDLLDLARSQEAQLRLKVTERDLVQYLSALVVDAQVLAHRKNIELVFLSSVPHATVWCDAERLDRVFVNLLANALKFTPDHGKVGVVVWQEADRVVVQVADTGPGFAKEYEEKVFDRFFQVEDGSTRTYGGTGIGLTLARDIVLLHGGTISATAEKGLGATFSVAFRRGWDHFPADALQASRTPADESTNRGLAGLALPDPSRYRLLDIETATEKRRLPRDPDEGRFRYSVLVVEDNDDVIHAISETLSSEFRVYAAANGEEGLERAIKHSPHLILTDYMMPKMDGVELLRRLRADARTRLTPVVLLTARGDVDSRLQGIEGGASAYISKPFDTKLLLATVRNLLETQAQNAEAFLHKQIDSLEVITSGLAHQINNPLNYTQNALRVIQRDTAEALALMGANVDADTRREGLADIERRITRMFGTADVGLRRISDTVELMRRYSRDGYQRVAEPYPLFDATRDVLRLVLPTAEGEVQVAADLEGEGLIDCVPDEVNQVITNLVQNAVDALNARSGGHVWVTGREEGREVVLSIRDDGPGIPPDVRARIFTPFFSTKGPGRGMGMGLFICHRIVSALGGSITVESQVGSGTEMTLRVPASRRTAQADNRATA